MLRKILCAIGLHWYTRTGRVETLFVDENPTMPYADREKCVCKCCGDIDWRKPKC